MTAKKTLPAKRESRPIGRPTKYKPEYCQDIVKFCSIEPTRQEPELDANGNPTGKYKEIVNNPPFISDWLRKVNINRDTVNNWKKKYPEFSDAYKKAEEARDKIIAINALRGHYNPTFSIFMMKNVAGWTDKTEVRAENTHIIKMEAIKRGVQEIEFDVE